jgi:hypothetical protein
VGLYNSVVFFPSEFRFFGKVSRAGFLLVPECSEFTRVVMTRLFLLMWSTSTLACMWACMWMIFPSLLQFAAVANLGL